MEFTYIAYSKDRKLVKGRLSAADDKSASGLLDTGGFQVVQIKPVSKSIDWKGLNARFAKVDKRELVMFSRQLALLIESGIGVIRGLEIIQLQTANPAFKTIIGEVIADLQDGKTLAAAMARHPKMFSQMYHRTISAGEQAGNLDEVLRQMADFIERSVNSEKKIKGALSYPMIVLVVAVVVIAVLVTFVLPAYTKLFATFGAKLPAITMVLMNGSAWAAKYGIYVMLVMLVVAVAGFAYSKTEKGALRWDDISLRMPVLGRINLLNQLSYSSRIMALLFRVGLRPPDVVSLAIDGSMNRVVKQSLQEVREEMIRGEGLSRPMSRRAVFLPLMVQMVSVGEETGNLAKSFTTIAQSYEADADERTRAAIGMISPVISIILGGTVAFIAIALVSAMYGVFGQINFS